MEFDLKLGRYLFEVVRGMYQLCSGLILLAIKASNRLSFQCVSITQVVQSTPKAHQHEKWQVNYSTMYFGQMSCP